VSSKHNGTRNEHFCSAPCFVWRFFVGGDDESLSVVAVCISNEDRLSVGINRCDAAPTPTGFAEIVSDDFPELHVDRIVPLLVSTQQSENDSNGCNEAQQRRPAAAVSTCRASWPTWPAAAWAEPSLWPSSASSEIRWPKSSGAYASRTPISN
jgi:hypothetical protein